MRSTFELVELVWDMNPESKYEISRPVTYVLWRTSSMSAIHFLGLDEFQAFNLPNLGNSFSSATSLKKSDERFGATFQTVSEGFVRNKFRVEN